MGELNMEILRISGFMKNDPNGQKLKELRLLTPKKYTLDKNHLRYFWDKMMYIHRRQQEVVIELNKRGLKALPIKRFPF